VGFPLGVAAHGARGMDVAVILAIETAVECVSVALGDHRGMTARAAAVGDRRHAETLAPMIEFLLAQLAATPADLSAVAVDAGPGLFTGMRVGIATAQAMAWALEIPVVPLCSLDILARRAPEGHDLVATAIDARRSEIYWALHAPRPDGTLVRLADPVTGSPEELAGILADRAEPVLCLGTGIERHREVFSGLAWARMADPALRFPDAADMVAMAAPVVAADGGTEPGAVTPIYLRAPDAEIHWQTRTGSR
jgi:tRNA threonylcarbamoyladenosine biosynthesis protein TsaB